MQISKEQMEAFSTKSLVAFEERMVIFLQDEFPDAKDISQQELLPVIHEQVNKARTYHLETEQQIAAYVITAWLLGRQFDTEFPAAQEMLLPSEYSADDKSEWLGQWTEEMFKALEGDR